MTLYVSEAEAKAYLKSTITADDTEITAALTAACDAIDLYCGRVFSVPTSATARTFVVDNAYRVAVDDIANTTGLVIVDAGATVPATDYQLETAPGRTNQVGNDGVSRPYTHIRSLGGTWHLPLHEEATLSITARWGWPATPEAVKLAAKLLTKDLFNMRETRFGFVQVGDFSRRVAENGMVASLLGPYRRAESWGIA